MNLIQFYKENIKENEYYFIFYDELITKYEAFKHDFEESFGSLNDEIEYDIFDDEEAIELYKKLLQPDTEYEKNNNKYLLVSYYLFKNGYVIEEFPRILERPEKNLLDFAHSTIRRRLIELGKNRPNGEVPYAQRKIFIANLHFTKKESTTIIIDDDINKMFKKISTRNHDFMQMTKSEQLQEISNLIENMLKKNGDFIKLDYSKIAFDYIDNNLVTKYRKQTQCFRHATDKALLERENFSDDQKDFLIQQGMVIVNLIYNLLYRNNQ